MAIETVSDDAAIASLDISTAKLYHVQNGTTVFGRNFPTAHTFASDAGCFCHDLKVAIGDKRGGGLEQKEHSRMIEAGKRSLNAYRSAMTGTEYPFDISKDDQVEPIKSCGAVTDLQAAMPVSTRYITHVGGHTFVACSFLEVKLPKHSSSVSSWDQWDQALVGQMDYL